MGLEENLILEFRGGMFLYVPASRIDLVQKYVGGQHSDPHLSKLGGTLWQRRKEKVEEAVMDLAAEMIDLQAVRLRQFTSPTNLGTAPNLYTPFHDVNGSGGIINSLALQAVRLRQFSGLPAPSLPLLSVPSVLSVVQSRSAQDSLKLEVAGPAPTT